MRIFYLLIVLQSLTLGQQVKGWDDIATPNLDFIQVSFDVPEGETNHAEIFFKLAESTVLPDDFYSLLHSALYDPQNVDPEALDEFLKANEQAIEELDELLANEPHIGLEGQSETAPSLLPLVHLFQARIICKLLSDQPTSALIHLRNMKQLTDILVDSASGFTSMQVALKARQELYQLYYVLTHDRSIKRKALDKMASILKETPTTSDKFQALIKDHCAKSVRSIYQIHTGEWDQNNPEKDKLNQQSQLSRRLALQPNRTASLFLNATTQRLANIALPANQRLQAQQVKPTLISSNSFGYLLFKDFIAHPKYLSSDLDYAVTHFRLTKVCLALRRYKADHKSLPDSLEKLVPNYLKILPEDPYTGQNLGYSHKTKLLWSIGPDQINQTLSLEQLELGYLSPSQQMEPTLSLDFP